MQHVLPKGFVKIRHYGLLAPRHREEKLTISRCLLEAQGVPGAFPAGRPAEELIAEAQLLHCPFCGSNKIIRREVRPTHRTCTALQRDVSSRSTIERKWEPSHDSR